MKNKLTNDLTEKQLLDLFKEEEKSLVGSILFFINQEDCMYSDFLDEGYFESLLLDLLYLKALWVTSDYRVKITNTGEKILSVLFENLVDIDSKKIKFLHYEPRK